MPGKNRFSYFLEGIDDDWNLSGNNRRLTYNSLQPGIYRLWVKGSNNDGVWNSKGVSISITILPPFWKSRTALIIYIVILLFSLGLFSYQIIRVSDKRHRNKLEKFRIGREKEIDQMKIEYFTRIAHEIRTPLTLIHGPLEKMIRKGIILKNIWNNDFSVEDLAHGLLMSKSNLYLKLKAISDVTPNDFIRIIRLKKAAELLAGGAFKINEVCYQVGFNTPSYFSKCFQLQFGVLPSDFVANV